MIHYDDSKHRYWDGGGDYISATTLVDRYVNPFDEEGMSRHIADKRGGTPDQWKRIWKENSDYKKQRGSAFHALKERQDAAQAVICQGRPVTVSNQELLLQSSRKWNYYGELSDGLYLELILWHPHYRVAGRADRVILRTEGGVRYMDLEDHKTNDEMPKESYYFRDGRGYKMMLPPLGHIMDCDYWHYCLQISLYQLMGEALGFLPGNRRILHYARHPVEIINRITPSPVELLARRPCIYDAPYLKDDVLLMCEDNLKRIRA